MYTIDMSMKVTIEIDGQSEDGIIEAMEQIASRLKEGVRCDYIEREDYTYFFDTDNPPNHKDKEIDNGT